jgi:hypothetical protein
MLQSDFKVIDPNAPRSVGRPGHHIEMDPVLFAGRVDGHNVRVVQLSGGFRFALESLYCVRVESLERAVFKQ